MVQLHTVLLPDGIVTDKRRPEIARTLRITRVAAGSCSNPGVVSNPIPRPNVQVVIALARGLTVPASALILFLEFPKGAHADPRLHFLAVHQTQRDGFDCAARDAARLRSPVRGRRNAG